MLQSVIAHEAGDLATTWLGRGGSKQGVDGRDNKRGHDWGKCMPCKAFPLFQKSGFSAVGHSPTLHDVQLLGVWGSVDIDDRPVTQADRVDDEGVSFVTADGFTIP